MALDWESDVLVDPYTLDPIPPLPGSSLNTIQKSRKPRAPRRHIPAFYDDEIIMPNPEYVPTSYAAMDQTMGEPGLMAGMDGNTEMPSMRPIAQAPVPHYDPYTVDQQTQLNDLAIEYLQR